MAVRMTSDSRDLHGTAGDIDEKQHVVRHPEVSKYSDAASSGYTIAQLGVRVGGEA